VVEPSNSALRTQWQQWYEENTRFIAPSLLNFEASNALYRYQRLAYMSSEAVAKALKAVLALPITLYSDKILHQSALDFASRYMLKAAYDAHYLALAAYLSAEFWTADQKLIRAVQSNLSWVHLVS